MTAVANGSGFTFDETGYIGVVDPDTANAERGWWAGWTLEDSVVIPETARTIDSPVVP